MQAGGERAGRQILLTLDDARAIAAESSMIAVVSPELERGAVQGEEQLQRRDRPRDRHRAAVSGHPHHRARIRPQLHVAGRSSRSSRVAIVGFDMAEQLFGKRNILGEADHAQRHAVHGGRQDPEEGPGQQLQRPGQQQDLRAVRRDVARPAARATPSPARCRTSSSPRRTGSSPSCRARSTSGPAGSRTSTGRSSRTSARFSRAATASTRTTSRRSRCGTPRCRR